MDAVKAALLDIPPGCVQATFSAWDLNGDGHVSFDELRAAAPQLDEVGAHLAARERACPKAGLE